ncbi:SDR family oxidoreductase [Streptomyces sp. NPDC020858]|uniref:SDR family oxidoreductase n=1 Tax=Streptomyces sp. NPDC020858 TaxID=3365097 RepID=UPI0037A8623C
MIDRCAALREPSFLTLRQICRSVPSWIRTCPAGPTCRGRGPGPRHGAATAVPMALVRPAAVEPGPRGVRVNAVAPGGVDPADRRPAGHRGAAAHRGGRAAGPGRRTADIAAAPYVPASPLSSCVTGQTLVVGGGAGVEFPYPTIGGEE